MSALQISKIRGENKELSLSSPKLVKGPTFETLPTEIRLEIHRELLLVEGKINPTDRGPYGRIGLNIAILRCNKKIHSEASRVLYGENTFHWMMGGDREYKLWHIRHSKKSPTSISKRCSRLITRVDLTLELWGNGNETIQNALCFLRTNTKHMASKLALNDLAVLSVRYNRYVSRTRSEFLSYFGQESLEPLRKLRATRVSEPIALVLRFWAEVGLMTMCQFSLEGNPVEPQMATDLKAVIEGPKDAAFLAARRKAEEADESELEDRHAEDENENSEDGWLWPF